MQKNSYTKMRGSYWVQPMIREIQALRGFAVIAVVLIHTVSAFVFMKEISPLSAAALSIDAFMHFAVPMFIFISGFVLALKSYPITTFYWKRFAFILPPYIIFSSLYALYYNKPIVPAIINADAETHLPFLRMLMILYLLFPLIIWLFEHNSPLVFIISAILWASPLPNYSPVLSFLYVLPYFVIGIYVSRNYEPAKRRLDSLNIIPVMLLILPLWALESQSWFSRYYGFYQIRPLINGDMIWFLPNALALVLYVLIFIVAYRFAPQLPWMDTIGNYSFGIYLVHQFYMSEVRKAMYASGLNYYNPIYYLILFIAAFSLSLITAYLWAKIWGWRKYGFSRSALAARSLLFR